MLWEDLEPGDKVMFNPEWVKKYSSKYSWWIDSAFEYENIKLEIRKIDISRNDSSNITIHLKHYSNDGFSIQRDTGRIWNSANKNDDLPLFKIVELKDD